MIFTQAKRYQVTLWTSTDRKGLAMRLEFDSIEQAILVFEQNAAERRYAAGLLFEWQKDTREWMLMGQYPNP